MLGVGYWATHSFVRCLAIACTLFPSARTEYETNVSNLSEHLREKQTESNYDEWFTTPEAGVSSIKLK